MGHFFYWRSLASTVFDLGSPIFFFSSPFDIYTVVKVFFSLPYFYLLRVVDGNCDTLTTESTTGVETPIGQTSLIPRRHGYIPC